MRFRRVLFGLAILVLVSGIFLFAVSIIRETRTSSGTWRIGPSMVRGGTFAYSALTESYNTAPQIIVGTSGIADLMILTTPWRDFNNWVCNHLPQLAPGYTWSCAGFGGWMSFLNVTILDSYLQTNQSQIAYSQTVVDQNVSLTSLAYHVTSWSDVTIVLAQLGSGWANNYWQMTVTNQTTSYPLLGYTEKLGPILTLPNISIGLVVAGGASIAILSVAQNRLQLFTRSLQIKGSATPNCPGCGGENLFFAEKCRHCGRPLHETPRMITARSS